MNLGKLFNFKYLKQNIKKSKGMLIVLVFIIPVITTLILIYNNSTEYVSATFQVVVAIANIIGMYVIPVIISYLLYGYVYKKNSVDFVGSMPITRKTVFFTNFVGGIILIFIIQALTAFATFISTMLMSNTYIATEMILDIFIVMFLSYSFVFSATTVAMTVSGNFLTQIVVTLLIVFLIPFVSIFGVYNIDKVINIELPNHVVKVDSPKTNDYTLPSSLIFGILDGNTRFYSFNRNVRTLILTLFYFTIGMYLFNKRKMENVEVSFSKTWVHLFVKAITLVPMVFILQLLEIKGVFLGIAIVLVFIYYSIYDFITNKKVSIKYTIPIFAISFLAIMGVYLGIKHTGEKVLNEHISIDDIKGIYIENHDYSGISSYYNENRKYDASYYIEDKDFIKKVCESIVYFDYTNDYPYSYNDLSWVYLEFKLQNGKEKHVSANIDRVIALEAIDRIKNSEEYLSNYKENQKIGNDAYIIANGEFLSMDDTKNIIDFYNNIDIKKKLEIEKEFRIGDRRNYIPQPDFCIYYYKNHELNQFEVNPFLAQELFDIINEISKKQLTKGLEEHSNSSENNYLYAYISERRENTRADDDFNHISFDRTEDLVKYISQHVNDKIDMNDSFYIVNINANNFNSISFYLKQTDELDYIIVKDMSYNNYYEDDVNRVDYYNDIEEIEDESIEENIEKNIVENVELYE